MSALDRRLSGGAEGDITAARSASAKPVDLSKDLRFDPALVSANRTYKALVQVGKRIYSDSRKSEALSAAPNQPFAIASAFKVVGREGKDKSVEGRDNHHYIWLKPTEEDPSVAIPDGSPITSVANVSFGNWIAFLFSTSDGKYQYDLITNKDRCVEARIVQDQKAYEQDFFFIRLVLEQANNTQRKGDRQDLSSVLQGQEPTLQGFGLLEDFEERSFTDKTLVSKDPFASLDGVLDFSSSSSSSSSSLDARDRSSELTPVASGDLSIAADPFSPDSSRDLSSASASLTRKSETSRILETYFNDPKHYALAIEETKKYGPMLVLKKLTGGQVFLRYFGKDYTNWKSVYSFLKSDEVIDKTPSEYRTKAAIDEIFLLKTELSKGSREQLEALHGGKMYGLDFPKEFLSDAKNRPVEYSRFFHSLSSEQKAEWDSWLISALRNPLLNEEYDPENDADDEEDPIKVLSLEALNSVAVLEYSGDQTKIVFIQKTPDGKEYLSIRNMTAFERFAAFIFTLGSKDIPEPKAFYVVQKHLMDSLSEFKQFLSPKDYNILQAAAREASRGTLTVYDPHVPDNTDDRDTSVVNALLAYIKDEKSILLQVEGDVEDEGKVENLRLNAVRYDSLRPVKRLEKTDWEKVSVLLTEENVNAFINALEADWMNLDDAKNLGLIYRLLKNLEPTYHRIESEVQRLHPSIAMKDSAGKPTSGSEKLMREAFPAYFLLLDYHQSLTKEFQLRKQKREALIAGEEARKAAELQARLEERAQPTDEGAKKVGAASSDDVSQTSEGIEGPSTSVSSFELSATDTYLPGDASALQTYAHNPNEYILRVEPLGDASYLVAFPVSDLDVMEKLQKTLLDLTDWKKVGEYFAKNERFDKILDKILRESGDDLEPVHAIVKKVFDKMHEVFEKKKKDYQETGTPTIGEGGFYTKEFTAYIEQEVPGYWYICKTLGKLEDMRNKLAAEPEVEMSVSQISELSSTASSDPETKALISFSEDPESVILIVEMDDTSQQLSAMRANQADRLDFDQLVTVLETGSGILGSIEKDKRSRTDWNSVSQYLKKDGRLERILSGLSGDESARQSARKLALEIHREMENIFGVMKKVYTESGASFSVADSALLSEEFITYTESQLPHTREEILALFEVRRICADFLAPPKSTSPVDLLSSSGSVGKNSGDSGVGSVSSAGFVKIPKPFSKSEIEALRTFGTDPQGHVLKVHKKGKDKELVVAKMTIFNRNWESQWKDVADYLGEPERLKDTLEQAKNVVYYRVMQEILTHVQPIIIGLEKEFVKKNPGKLVLVGPSLSHEFMKYIMEKFPAYGVLQDFMLQVLNVDLGSSPEHEDSEEVIDDGSKSLDSSDSADGQLRSISED